MNIDKAIQSAVAFHSQGNLKQAEYLYKKILTKKPNNPDILNKLGELYCQVANYDLAIRYIKKALQFRPTDIASTYYNLGWALQRKGQLDEAITHYQKAIELNPFLAKAYCNLGWALFQGQGQLDEAITYYQKAIELNPSFAEAYNNMGLAFAAQGKFNEGIRCFKKALQLKSTYPRALFNLVRNQGLSFGDSKELFKLTKKMIKQDMSENELIDVYFTMGKLCDNLQMFKESFEYYRLGNELKRFQVEFNIDSHVDYVSQIKGIFSDDFIKNRNSWGCNSEMPVFIFGMPRAGTTLVEQIIASHPNVYGGGELGFFSQMDQKLPSILNVNERYPECLNHLNDQTACDIAELYIKGLRKLAGPSKDHTRITDKNPLNFYHLALIALLFPKASFIHCQRYPLDTCISIYFQNFVAGNRFAYNLRELGQYYLEYLKVMNHWRRVLPINIFEVKYEDIVQQQEEVSRKLIEFCGLEWDSACLDFYNKDRPVFTASSWQVRQPIYATSCGRWQNYEQFLDPLKELLADFI